MAGWGRGFRGLLATETVPMVRMDLVPGAAVLGLDPLRPLADHSSRIEAEDATSGIAYEAREVSSEKVTSLKKHRLDSFIAPMVSRVHRG